MAKIKAGILDKGVTEKISIGENRVADLTGNANLPVNPAKLTAFKTATDALKAAKENVSLATTNLAQMYITQSLAEKEYDRQTSLIVSEINGLTDDETKLVTSGFHLISKNGSDSPNVLHKPENVTASVGDDSGEVDIHWNSVKTAQGYSIQHSLDSNFPKDAVTNTPIGRTSKATLKGLTTGTRVWVRVAALKGKDMSAWSDPAVSIVS